jgi:hypothetical protein
LEDNIRLSWTITREKTIVVTILSNYKSWVGIGWHCKSCGEDGMTKADFIITTFGADGTPTVRKKKTKTKH